MIELKVLVIIVKINTVPQASYSKNTVERIILKLENYLFDFQKRCHLTMKFYDLWIRWGSRLTAAELHRVQIRTRTREVSASKSSVSSKQMDGLGIPTLHIPIKLSSWLKAYAKSLTSSSLEWFAAEAFLLVQPIPTIFHSFQEGFLINEFIISGEKTQSRRNFSSMATTICRVDQFALNISLNVPAQEVLGSNSFLGTDCEIDVSQNIMMRIQSINSLISSYAAFWAARFSSTFARYQAHLELLDSYQLSFFFDLLLFICLRGFLRILQSDADRDRSITSDVTLQILTSRYLEIVVSMMTDIRTIFLIFDLMQYSSRLISSSKFQATLCLSTSVLYCGLELFVLIHDCNWSYPSSRFVLIVTSAAMLSDNDVDNISTLCILDLTVDPSDTLGCKFIMYQYSHV